MGTKNKPGDFDCYSSAEPDEPMFVLLGRDPMAGALVRAWVELRGQRGGEDTAKLVEALNCASAMDAWARTHGKAPLVSMEKSAAQILASCVKDGVLQMRDVDRAKVYGEHLGEKLREVGKPGRRDE